MFGVPYMVNTSNKSLKSFVRIENSADLFYNGISTSPIEVLADGMSLTIGRNANNGLTVNISTNSDESKYSFTAALTLSTKKEPVALPPIVGYFFPKQFVSESSNCGFLLPPSGANLMATVANMPNLKEELAELFHAYGLKMVFDSGAQQIKAMRENGLDMFLVPFSALADSLQRLIFYKTAIAGNNGRVICFEEPEAHTFPPYISNVVNDIISDKRNQYFITTHSPYVINSLIESSGDDLAVFVVDLNHNETFIRRLTDNQLQQVYDNGIDLFYNLEAYIG